MNPYPEGVTITIDIFDGLTGDEAEEIFDRVTDAICGIDHTPEDECPISFMSSMGPLKEYDE